MLPQFGGHPGSLSSPRHSAGMPRGEMVYGLEPVPKQVLGYEEERTRGNGHVSGYAVECESMRVFAVRFTINWMWV